MKKVLLMYKGRLTDREFKSTYQKAIKQHLGTNVDIELMPVYHPNGMKKVPRAIQKDWLKEVEPVLSNFDYILVSEPEYFKVISKQTKAESNIGLIFDTDYGNKALYLPSSQAVFFNPDKANQQIDQCLSALSADINGNYSEIGSDIIHFAAYPTTIEGIAAWLDKLKEYPALTCDIEAKSLKVTEAGIYTIGFAWDKHNGICFPVDAIPEQKETVRNLLLEFFETYNGKLIVHKANYDIPVINYTLFQKEDITDVENQVRGLNRLCRNLDDTLLITYLATNSCAGNTLGLKELAQPFAGNWAVDVSDVTKVDLQELMTYNLIDCLSTWYVYETYYPKMVEDEQEQLYKEHFLPYLKDNMRCQLNGLPIDLQEVTKLKADLLDEQKRLLEYLTSRQAIRNAEYQIAEHLTLQRNAKLKKKQTTVEENLQPFNFSSGKHLMVLLYDIMQLPIVDFTESKQPSTSKGTMEKLMNHTENQEYKDILVSLMELSDVEKMLTTFIPPFEQAHVDKHGQARLLGYFNLGGTVSGRLSSSNINLQQLPATSSRFAKPIKRCFKSTAEWIFVGLDYASLEDRISALTTKDPNKLDVYIKGFDGHCLRAYAYFQDQMRDIEDEFSRATSPEEQVKVINSIADRYPKLRQMSKAPTFALTYQGTYLTLMKNLGFSEALAKQIEASYHQLYKVSDEWVQKHLEQAKIDGYVTVAFGLRVRTPILKAKPDSSLAAAEGRTAGNALGQGWGMLNSRAMNKVMEQVDAMGLTQDILPVAMIHDATYYLVRNDVKVIETINRLAVEQAYWNDHPDIYHPEVGLGGQLDLFYPSWATPITLPEECDENCLIETVQEHLED